MCYRAIYETGISVAVLDRLWHSECEVQYHRSGVSTAIDPFESSCKGAVHVSGL